MLNISFKLYDVNYTRIEIFTQQKFGTQRFEAR